MVRRFALLMVLVFVSAGLVSCASQEYGGSVSGGAGRVSFVKGDDKVDVLIDGELFTSYLFGDELLKPVLFPVRTPSGVVVTRSYPLGEKVEGESEDHPHHVGVFFTYDGVNDEGFWNNSKNPLPKVRHAKFTEMKGGVGSGRLSMVMDWVGKDGRAVLREERTMIFRAGVGESIVDFSMDLKAVDAQVVFKDTKEGMFAIRTAPWLREDRGKNWPEGMEGTARYLSSASEEGAKAIWAKRAKWVRLEGEKDGKVCGVAILNHPTSVNYPTYWHARGYGLFSAGPLGQGYFQKARKVENPQWLNLTLEAGEKVHFGFRMIFYEGPRGKEQLDKSFAGYAK